MKAPTRILGLFILSILFINNSLAQKASFTTNGGMTIGFGAGKAYQRSDLANSNGLGFDFVLGSQIYKKENAFLSVDWKFRFLPGENKAYDHRINPDNTFSNIRYSFFNYDLEVGLTLNRLRERTRIVLTGFAGAGITHGRTFTDLYDSGNNLYDFSSIDPNRDRKLVYKDLAALSDGDFETRLVNKAAILPTAGIFIGYQLSRSFSLGLEYKTNFYLTEKNSFAGIDLDNRVNTGSGLDRNNYISLGFRWKLRGGSSYSTAANNYSSGVTNNYGNTNRTNNRMVPASLPRPSVIITNPSTNSYHTVSYTHTIKATVKNVNGQDNISFYKNGFPDYNFTYNVTTKIFTANVRLRDGENSFRIKATNQTAAAEDLVMITRDTPREVVTPAPLVSFTSPSRNQITSSSDRMNVTASVKNVSSKQDIQLTLNGRNIPFEFYPVSGLVQTGVMLDEGDNNLLINGLNESGSAQDQLTIYFNTPEEAALPTVRYIHPANPMNVENQRFPLRAKTQNVLRQNNISVIVNGVRIDNFSLSPDGEVFASLLLSEGVNNVEITARNEAGFTSERTSIGYHEPVVFRSFPPVINMISPANNPVRTYEQNADLRASVLNVDSKENITLQINGFSTRDFNYNNSTKMLTAGVALREGRNLVTINAQNESGSDVKGQEYIKEIRPCPQPEIRLIAPAREQNSTNQQVYAFRAEVRNITSKIQLNLRVNGNPVPFSFNNNQVSSSVPLISGSNTLTLNAKNECGEDKALARLSYNPLVIIDPCTPPTVAFTLNEVNREDATHELRGTITGLKNKTGISLTLDGRADNGFQFVPATGNLSAKFKLVPGTHTIVVSVKNDCGQDTKSESVTVAVAVVVEKEGCGIRINPGNAAWQFCLVTPKGTFSRENLSNSNFSYSGSATNLYFMPIGGGGEATVNGRPYAIRSGQYYLFTGKLNVTVSTKNPGSMGQWSICINADRAPISGNGNNRPKSPCEVIQDKGLKGNGNKR
jgi:large repetitive protein